MNKNDKWLQINWMKLKKIKRDIIMMTMAPLKSEQHYIILKEALYPIDRAITIMKQLIEEED